MAGRSGTTMSLVRFAENEGVEVIRWTGEQLARDEMIVQFARGFTSHGWSQSAGDTVAQRTTRANVEHLEGITMKTAFALVRGAADRKYQTGGPSEAWFQPAPSMARTVTKPCR
jgi:hypothetical protein